MVLDQVFGDPGCLEIATRLISELSLRRSDSVMEDLVGGSGINDFNLFLPFGGLHDELLCVRYPELAHGFKILNGAIQSQALKSN